MNKDTIIGIIKGYPLALTCIVLTLGSLAALFLRGGIVDELIIAEGDHNSRLRIIQKNLQNSQNLSEDLQSLESVLSGVSERLFDREERAVNINFFYAFEDEVDVVLTSISQRNGGDPLYDKKGSRALKKYSTLVYDIDVAGSFSSVVEFIEKLSLVDPLIRVADYNVSTSGKGATRNSVNADLRVIVLAKK